MKTPGNGISCAKKKTESLKCYLIRGKEQRNGLQAFASFAKEPSSRERAEGSEASSLRTVLTWEKLPPGHGSCPVILVLHEGKAAVFGFICSAWVDDDIHDSFGDLSHL